MFHPDTQIELIRSFQDERAQNARRNRLLSEAWLPKASRRDRFLLWMGEWLIKFGTNLKNQVRESVRTSEQSWSAS